MVLSGWILTGCGGSGAQKAQSWQTVRVAAARFQVPASWRVVARKTAANASGNSQLVEVQTFPLVRTYRPALFEKVASELALRMSGVARKTGGTIAGHSVVTAGGIKSHSYEVRIGKRTDTYTFVLRGKREYQLICSADESVCEHLVASFGVT